MALTLRWDTPDKKPVANALKEIKKETGLGSFQKVIERAVLDYRKQQKTIWQLNDELRKKNAEIESMQAEKRILKEFGKLINAK